MFKFILLFITILCHNVLYVKTKKLEGTLITNKEWVFLTRFCFLSKAGQLSYQFEFAKSLAPMHLLFYYDEPSQWHAVYKKNIPCTLAIKEPFLNRAQYQDVPLQDPSDSTDPEWSDCTVHGEMIRCASVKTFEASRQRWWYLALARCSNLTIKGLYLKYKLHMLNGDSHMTKELSADEFYILETSIVFIIGFLVIFVIACKFSYNLRQRMLLHTTYRMFLASLLLVVISLFVTCIAYGKFVNTGHEDYDLKVIGKAIMAFSQVMFLCMLLLLAKGFNVTRGRLSQSSYVKIFIFIVCYSLIYVVLFFNHVFSDPGLVLYLYESVPGYGLIGLKIIAWIYFSYACFITLKHYPEKKSFYYPLYAFYTVWFLIGPLFVLISLFSLENYNREKIVNGVELSIAFLSYVYLLFLTRPSHSNKNFPYHVRTSQVGIMEEVSSSIDDNINFKSSAYAAPSSNSLTAPDFSNLFDVVRHVYSQNTSADVNTPGVNTHPSQSSGGSESWNKNRRDGGKMAGNGTEGNMAGSGTVKDAINRFKFSQNNTTK